jgi:hypothetical protein
MLLLRGVCKGEPSTTLAAELALSRQSVHKWRKRSQANAYAMLSQTALRDEATETDEMFQNAGKKGEKHADPLDHRAVGPASDVGTEPMRMIAHQ